MKAQQQGARGTGRTTGRTQPVCRGLRVNVNAELSYKGRAILPSSITVERTMGEGSFGIVHMGQWNTPNGMQRVVLKRVKTSVEGAQQMGEMELLLNAYAAKVAKSYIADYLGYCEVAKEESTARLTPGLWLMWRYEGSRTLHYYLRRRDTLRALASDLEVSEEAVVATVMKQIFEAIAAFHAAGLVHRDIKPLNIVFAEDIKRFKIIDLGACADLRTGTNYTPDESILDPNYCPPEQYVLPTDSPHLAKSYFKLAISPMLWAQHKPDRFDMWSAGVTLLQLSVPQMRQDRVLKRFNQDYGPKYNYDLDAWRAGSYIPNKDFEVLDADGGTGWELAKALLRPRSIRTLADNTVVFVNDNSLQRISAGEALRHKFLKQAREPGSILEESGQSSGSAGKAGSSQRPTGRGAATASTSGSRSSSGSAARGSAGNKRGTSNRSGNSTDEEAAAAATTGKRNAGTFGAAVSLWRNLTDKLFDLEANIMVTASATEKQTTVVKQLQAKAQQGQVSKEVLQKEQKKLQSMEKDLSNLQDDFNTTANAVGNVLGFLGFGATKPKNPRPAPPPPAPEPVKIKTEGIKASAPIKASVPSFFGRSFGSMTSSGDDPDAGSGSGKQYTPGPISPVTNNAAQAVGGGSAGLWAAVQQRLSDLELKLTNQAAATERQVFTVRQLRARVQKGQADESTLSRAEKILQKMERRVNELDKDLKQTRQEATGLLGMLASSVNQMRGGTQDAKGQEPPSPSPPPPASRAAPAPPQAAVAPAAPVKEALESSGMGGFFNRMFGMGSGNQAKPASPAAPSPPPAAPSPIPAATQSRDELSPSPSSGSQLQSAGINTAAISDGASNLIASSLKFTGMAAKVAINMAAAMKADAEKVLKELEAEAEAKRVRKMTEQAFMRMLRTKEPPMQPSTTMNEVETAFGQDPRFLAVEESQRAVLVSSYIDALVQAQQRTVEQAKAKLRDLFTMSKLGSTWEDVSTQYNDNPVFLAVEDPAERQALFEEVMSAMKIAEEARLAMGLAEQAFLDMLAELEPPITRDTTWPRVKPLVWRDYRYLAVPEPRRKELFEEVLAMVVEQTKIQAEQNKEKVEAVAESVTEIIKDTAPTPAAISPSLLDELKKEQNRLRSEYEEMERKLREMEAAMLAKERASQLLASNPAPPPARLPTPTAAAAASAPVVANRPAAPPPARATTPSLQRGASGRGQQPAPTGTSPVAAAGQADGQTSAAQLAAGARNALARIVTPGRARITTPPIARGGKADDPALRQQEQQVAQSLEAAGVHYQRLKDGTLVFTFDGSDDMEPEQVSGAGGNSSDTNTNMAQVGASNGKV